MTNKVFITFIERNQREGVTLRFYIRLYGNFKQIESLASYLKWQHPRCYEIDWTFIRENAVDRLVENSGENYSPLHTKLDGHLKWSKEIQEHMEQVSRKAISWQIIRNCSQWQSENRKFFQPFDVPPTQYIVLSHVDTWKLNTDRSQTAIQYNGNEGEIEAFKKDYLKDQLYHPEFHIGETILDAPLPESFLSVIDGKFNYTQSIADYKEANYFQIIHDALYKGGIRNFVHNVL